MKEIFLLKLGEIVLKGANKRQFESRLRQNVRRRMKRFGNFDVYIMSADGGAARRLTTHSASELPTAFTPDGKQVLFTASIQTLRPS